MIEVCKHTKCNHNSAKGVGGCLHVPPDECHIKKALDHLNAVKQCVKILTSRLNESNELKEKYDLALKHSINQHDEIKKLKQDLAIHKKALGLASEEIDLSVVCRTCKVRGCGSDGVLCPEDKKSNLQSKTDHYLQQAREQEEPTP